MPHLPPSPPPSSTTSEPMMDIPVQDFLPSPELSNDERCSTPLLPVLLLPQSDYSRPRDRAGFILPPGYLIVTDVGMVQREFAFFFLVMGHRVWDWNVKSRQRFKEVTVHSMERDLIGSQNMTEQQRRMELWRTMPHGWVWDDGVRVRSGTKRWKARSEWSNTMVSQPGIGLPLGDSSRTAKNDRWIKTSHGVAQPKKAKGGPNIISASLAASAAASLVQLPEQATRHSRYKSWSDCGETGNAMLKDEQRKTRPRSKTLPQVVNRHLEISPKSEGLNYEGRCWTPVSAENASGDKGTGKEEVFDDSMSQISMVSNPWQHQDPFEDRELDMAFLRSWNVEAAAWRIAQRGRAHSV